MAGAKASLALCEMFRDKDVEILETFTADERLKANAALAKIRATAGDRKWNYALLPYEKKQVKLPPGTTFPGVI